MANKATERAGTHGDKSDCKKWKYSYFIRAYEQFPETLSNLSTLR